MARQFTPKQFYDELIRNMPAGLERAMLRVLSAHIGKQNAISKPVMMANLAQLGFHVDERLARKTIEGLRNEGHLIGASSGEGGYFIMATDEEWQAWYAEEMSRAQKILTRLKAQDVNARKVFLPVSEKAEQVGLF